MEVNKPTLINARVAIISILVCELPVFASVVVAAGVVVPAVPSVVKVLSVEYPVPPELVAYD